MSTPPVFRFLGKAGPPLFVQREKKKVIFSFFFFGARARTVHLLSFFSSLSAVSTSQVTLPENSFCILIFTVGGSPLPFFFHCKREIRFVLPRQSEKVRCSRPPFSSRTRKLTLRLFLSLFFKRKAIRALLLLTGVSNNPFPLPQSKGLLTFFPFLSFSHRIP